MGEREGDPGYKEDSEGVGPEVMGDRVRAVGGAGYDKTKNWVGLETNIIICWGGKGGSDEGDVLENKIGLMDGTGTWDWEPDDAGEDPAKQNGPAVWKDSSIAKRCTEKGAP